MTQQTMTEPEAFRWIQRTAMDRRTTMKAVAEAVVNGCSARVWTSDAGGRPLAMHTGGLRSGKGPMSDDDYGECVP